MTIFAPWAFYFLTAIPVIVLFYLLRQKHSERTVSSLYLWNEVMKSIETAASWQKLRKNLLMFLQLIAAALIVFALSNPYYPRTDNTKVAVILADTSFSMQAEDVKPNRFEAARKQMLKVVSDLQPGTKVTLMTLGTETTVRENLCTDKNQLLSTVQSLQVTNGISDFNQAATLLRSVVDQNPGCEVYYFGDSLFTGNYKNQLFDFSNKGDNYAVLLLSHTSDKNNITELSTVANYSGSDVELPVSLYVDGKVFDAQKVNIKAGDTASVYWKGLPANMQTLECRIDAEDSLDADNRAWDTFNHKTESKILLVSHKNTFLEKALSLVENGKIYRTDSVRESGLFGYDLYVFDGALPKSLPQDGSIMIFNPPENKFIETGSEFSVPAVEKSTHPLFNYITDYSFVINKSREIKVPAWGETVLKSGDKPLIIAGTLDNRRVLVFGFDLHQSDIALTPAFPILMNNSLEWLMPAGTENIDNIIPGQAVSLNIRPKAEQASVRTPSGSVVELMPLLPPRLFEATCETGLYTLEQKLPGELVKNYFVVNAPAQAESDLLKESSFIWDSGMKSSAVASKPTKSINLQPFLLWGILLLLLLEWGVYRYDI